MSIAGASVEFRSVNSMDPTYVGGPQKKIETNIHVVRVLLESVCSRVISEEGPTAPK